MQIECAVSQLSLQLQPEVVNFLLDFDPRLHRYGFSLIENELPLEFFAPDQQPLTMLRAATPGLIYSDCSYICSSLYSENMKSFLDAGVDASEFYIFNFKATEKFTKLGISSPRFNFLQFPFTYFRKVLICLFLIL